MRPKARIIVPIDYFATLSPDSQNPQAFNCSMLSSVLLKVAENLKEQKIYYETEVEFILLTTVEYLKEKSFRKELENSTHIIITESQIKGYLIPKLKANTKISEIQEREISALDKARFFLENAKREALISPGNEILKRTIERGKNLNPEDPTQFVKIRRLLDEFLSFFEKLDENCPPEFEEQDLIYLDEKDLKAYEEAKKAHEKDIAEYQKAEFAFNKLKECLMHLENQGTVNLQGVFQAMEAASDFFSQFPMILNAQELNLLDKEQEAIPTLLLLSSQTTLVGSLEEHIHVLRGYSSGEPSRVDLPLLDNLLASEFKRVNVYIDFDGTTLHSAMVRFGTEYGTNPKLAAILNTILERHPGAEFQLLTSRQPFHFGLENTLKVILELFTQLKQFKLIKESHPEEMVNLSPLEEEIQAIKQELKAVLKKKHLDLHQEIAEITAIFRKMIKFTEIESLIGFPAETTQESNASFYKICSEIKRPLFGIFHTMEFACVSKFTNQYEKEYGLSIQISNERHLCRTLKNNRYKIRYIEDEHEIDEEKTLVILIDDSFEELDDYRKRCPDQGDRKYLSNNTKVRTFAIQIHHDGCTKDTINNAAYNRFLQALSLNPEKEEGSRLLLKKSKGPERSSTPVVMSRPETPPLPQSYYGSLFNSKNTSVIFNESGVFTHKEGSHNLKLMILMSSDQISITVDNLNSLESKSFRLLENNCMTYDNVEFRRTKSGELRVEYKNEPAALEQSNLVPH